jgi:curved DNA-binding protein CbpA
MTSEQRRAYRILGVAPGASKDEVKQAYRDLAQVWHPDRFSHSDRLRDKAQVNLGRINEAFDVLKDYEPVGPRPSRLSMAMSAVLDIGDIRQSREIHGMREAEKAQAFRREPVVLGVNRGADRERSGRAVWLLVLVLLAAVLAVLATVLQ